MTRNSIRAVSLCALITPVAHAATVSVPEKSQPENGAGKVDVVAVNGDSASVTVLQEGLATPTAIEPAGNVLWYGERAGDRARSMPLPK